MCPRWGTPTGVRTTTRRETIKSGAHTARWGTARVDTSPWNTTAMCTRGGNTHRRWLHTRAVVTPRHVQPRWEHPSLVGTHVSRGYTTSMRTRDESTHRWWVHTCPVVTLRPCAPAMRTSIAGGYTQVPWLHHVHVHPQWEHPSLVGTHMSRGYTTSMCTRDERTPIAGGYTHVPWLHHVHVHSR
jgi:hypothetical protein